jgi:hypothetical protein
VRYIRPRRDHGAEIRDHKPHFPGTFAALQQLRGLSRVTWQKKPLFIFL